MSLPLAHGLHRNWKNKGGMPMNLSIKITQKHSKELMRHLHSGDGLEAVAFAICGTANNNSILLVQEIVVIPYESCPIRTVDRVTWRSDSLQDIFQKAEVNENSIIKFHSHPLGGIHFSEFDDTSDKSLFPRVYNWLSSSNQHASVIVTPDGKMTARHVSENGDFFPIEKVTLVGADIKSLSNNSKFNSKGYVNGSKRVAQTFGANTFKLLNSLRIGVVGCSGTGSPVIEQLARTCVGELVLIDPDIIDEGNLNRITSSTLLHAKEGAPKVQVLKEYVDSMGFGTNVTTFQKDLFDVDVVKALSTCDIVFGCMDSIDGRHLLNKLATFYLVPYFDLGVKLVADGKGGIDRVCGQVHYLQPGRSSLFSRGVYNMEQLRAAGMYRTSPDDYEELRKSGYIDGVNENNPAVSTVNNLVSSNAVFDFLARIHAIRKFSNEDVAVTRFSFDQGLQLCEPEKGDCQMLIKLAGLGDQPLLLNTPELSSSEGVA